MKLKQTLGLFKLLLISIFLFSCSEEEFLTDTNNIEQENNFINLVEIENIAKDITHRVNDETLISKGVFTKIKAIKELHEIPDENGNTSFYVINYESGGFVLLSSDKRIKPVLAYSDNGYFPINKETIYPSSLVSWLSGTKDKIKEVRNLNVIQSKEVKQSWSLQQIQNLVSRIDEPIDGTSCENEYETVGPLLQTVWGQGTGYNNSTPVTGCTNYSNGHAPTGCVATAMAQIMKYHQSPSSYNWSLMPNTYGTNETSLLMRDVGDAVNMDYGCNGSSASTEDEVASSFINDFNYSSASYSGYNSETVKQQLRWNRPVILRGGRNTGWWIFNQYSDGHAWVCDGFRRSFIWSEDCSMAWGYLYLHMNWGWSSSSLNGWFAFNNWNPSTHTFNYSRGMVYNIKP